MPAQNQLEPVEPATAVPKGTTMATRDWACWRYEWPSTDGYAPDDRLFVPSLFVLAFATMHLRPPTRRGHKTMNA